MTEQVYHDPSRKNKCDFQIEDRISQLNDEINMHLEKLYSLTVLANTHEKLGQCSERVLNGYLWVVEDEINELTEAYDEVSIYL